MDEIRCSIKIEDRAEGARIVGTLMDYGQRATDRPEIFEASALKWDGPLILNRQHSRKNPILKFTPIESEGKLLVDVEVPSTTAGADALSEIRSGLFSGLSIEFRAVSERFVNGVRRISEGILSGAALVDFPAYSSSVVEARELAARDSEWERWQREMVL